MVADFETLFSPYCHLRLSAFDNMKLIAAVLADATESYECVEADVQGEQNPQLQQAGYFVRWNDMWLFCGVTNDYHAAITMFTQVERINLTSISVKEVPVMSMQQVSFMCIESSHFDHC
ncbi:hypothetical protein [Shewanella livingstonensis]|uniref:Uncharacterized protein n=1 Tax=Shewanella livingstonensis TaxID=150120 RepID=A0A3G8LXV8_9GAMM|nr:hypothetical protein [Shewanella livingstonensis]AZG74536.1 hypothetical protein EGC82_18375 [Shewanella livingstonensis]